MTSHFWHRWFKLGGIPKREREQLESEQIVLLEEGLRGSVTLRKFKGHGRRSRYRKSIIIGAVVVTKKRFVAFSLWRPIVNITLEPEHITKLKVTQHLGARLEIAFEAADFMPGCSGSVCISYKTEKAQAIKRLLSKAARS